MPRKKCLPKLTIGQKIRQIAIKIFKWVLILGVTIAVSVVHDMLWFSDFNPLYKGSASSQTMADYVIKASIITAVFWYIVPSFSPFPIIAVHAALLSWMALAQNLPNIDLKNDIGRVWMEHLKCAIHLVIKFFLFRLIQNLRTNLAV